MDLLQFKHLVLYCLTAFVTQGLNAQVNIKVGYGLAYFNAQANNAVLSNFNDVKSDEFGNGLVRELTPLHIMHGITLGMRYRLTGPHAIEIGWENLKNDKEAVGENLTGGLFSQSLFYSSNQYHLSYALQKGIYGFGLGYGWGRIKIKDEIGSSDVKKDIVDASQNVLRFNLVLHFKGNRQVSFSIQPYYHMNLNAQSNEILADELGITTQNQAEDHFNRFGINFVFYNGKQP